MKKKQIIIFLILLGISHNLTSQNKNITINIKRNSDNSVDFYYEKKLPGSFYISIEFTSLSNTYNKKYHTVVKNNSGRLFKLKPINKEQPINFSYKYSYIQGTPNPKVDKLFAYTLPFKKEKGITILESTNLNEVYFGSEKPSNWKSYVIDRTYADTVCSMRKGLVVKIVNEFNTDTLTQYSYKSKMNSILIEHSDGTFASYKGFKKNSFLVKLGQTVYPQSQLGILDAFNDSTYRLYFHIYYLINNDLNLKGKVSLKEQKSNNGFLTPYFYTTNGSEQLKHKNDYIIDFNEATFFQEFTKREKKKYLKNPENFN
ncbi:hypothetical protein [Flavivirga algicola]|uniref:Peptidase M23 domain-containing protein n=1 Tax=Flavivirga algicola TaxID=2729136 RepID=A0ABX1RUR1_9FLAO|nr:hypothetical protein [Flavivirga algicola]NMH86229.1 hypothetical protein [Flavivirga algicola]